MSRIIGVRTMIIIKKLTKKFNNNYEEDEEEIVYWSNEINKALISCRQIFCDGNIIIIYYIN